MQNLPSSSKPVLTNVLGLFFKLIFFLENNERVRFKWIKCISSSSNYKKRMWCCLLFKKIEFIFYLLNISWGCLPITKIFEGIFHLKKIIEVLFHLQNIWGFLPFSKIFEVLLLLQKKLGCLLFTKLLHFNLLQSDNWNWIKLSAN